MTNVSDHRVIVVARAAQLPRPDRQGVAAVGYYIFRHGRTEREGGDMTHEENEVIVIVELGAGPDDDAIDVEHGAIDIRRELSSLGTLQPVPVTPGPDGTRAGGVEPGIFSVAIAPAATLLSAALRTLLAWARRGRERSVKITLSDGAGIDLTGLSEADQHELIQVWISTATTR
jgi:hypothetical protein